TLIRQLYDGTVIRANYPLAEGERKRRIQHFYRPYHDAVSSVVTSVAEMTGAAPLVISVHSFTPFMQGRERPWHVGILWDRDDRAVKPLIAALQQSPGIIVGD